MVAGVAGGIADALSVDVAPVRLAFAVLSLVSGAGVLLDAACWLFLPVDDGTSPVVDTRTRTDGTDVVQGLALASVVLGTALLFRTLGLWFPDRLLWPTVIASAGLAMVWKRSPPNPDQELGPVDLTPRSLLAVLQGRWSGSGRRTGARIAVGALLVLTGAGAFVAANGSLTALRQGLLAGVVLVLGLALIVGPWLVGLTEDLAAERRARIRADAQSEFAAHLHDSVLQTLAIIQRRAAEPREVVTLARRQERELRAWLYNATEARHDDGSTIAQALIASAQEVESDLGIRLEVVHVGDCPVDDRLQAILGAAREAMVNAAKHAGVDEVAVFAEVTPTLVEVFVRDRGCGFDPTRTAPDRRGLADSITARVERAGGSVRIHTEEGVGTEVQMQMGRTPA